MGVVERQGLRSVYPCSNRTSRLQATGKDAAVTTKAQQMLSDVQNMLGQDAEDVPSTSRNDAMVEAVMELLNPGVGHKSVHGLASGCFGPCSSSASPWHS